LLRSAALTWVAPPVGALVGSEALAACVATVALSAIASPMAAARAKILLRMVVPFPIGIV
jgi:hypothetical protein